MFIKSIYPDTIIFSNHLPICSCNLLNLLQKLLPQKNQHILLLVIFCHFCGGNMTRSGLVWRCTTKACRRAISVFVHSFFSGKRIKVNNALMIAYLWLANDTHKSICEKTKISTKTDTFCVRTSNFGRTNELISLSTNWRTWNCCGNRRILIWKEKIQSRSPGGGSLGRWWSRKDS